LVDVGGVELKASISMKQAELSSKQLAKQMRQPYVSAINK